MASPRFPGGTNVSVLVQQYNSTSSQTPSGAPQQDSNVAARIAQFGGGAARGGRSRQRGNGQGRAVRRGPPQNPAPPRPARMGVGAGQPSAPQRQAPGAPPRGVLTQADASRTRGERSGAGDALPLPPRNTRPNRGGAAHRGGGRANGAWGERIVPSQTRQANTRRQQNQPGQHRSIPVAVATATQPAVTRQPAVERISLLIANIQLDAASNVRDSDITGAVEGILAEVPGLYQAMLTARAELQRARDEHTEKKTSYEREEKRRKENREDIGCIKNRVFGVPIVGRAFQYGSDGKKYRDLRKTAERFGERYDGLEAARVAELAAVSASSAATQAFGRAYVTSRVRVAVRAAYEADEQLQLINRVLAEKERLRDLGMQTARELKVPLEAWGQLRDRLAEDAERFRLLNYWAIADTPEGETLRGSILEGVRLLKEILPAPVEALLAEPGMPVFSEYANGGLRRALNAAADVLADVENLEALQPALDACQRAVEEFELEFQQASHQNLEEPVNITKKQRNTRRAYLCDGYMERVGDQLVAEAYAPYANVIDARGVVRDTVVDATLRGNHG